MTHHQRLLTVTEAAHRCEVDPRTIRRWCKARRLAHYVTPSGRYLVPASELQLLGGPL